MTAAAQPNQETLEGQLDHGVQDGQPGVGIQNRQPDQRLQPDVALEAAACGSSDGHGAATKKSAASEAAVDSGAGGQSTGSGAQLDGQLLEGLTMEAVAMDVDQPVTAAAAVRLSEGHSGPEAAGKDTSDSRQQQLEADCNEPEVCIARSLSMLQRLQQTREPGSPGRLVRASIHVLGPGVAEEGSVLYALTPSEAAALRWGVIQRKSLQGGAEGTPQGSAMAAAAGVGRKERAKQLRDAALKSAAKRAKQPIGYVTSGAPRGLVRELPIAIELPSAGIIE